MSYARIVPLAAIQPNHPVLHSHKCAGTAPLMRWLALTAHLSADGTPC
jgi:hypothetical protein